MQLLYNPQNQLEFFRTNFAVVLGWWHPYKVASESLFFSFLPTFLGRAWHSLYPSQKISSTTDLSLLEDFFGILSCAYPTFRANLLHLSARADANDYYFQDIQNLRDLFEFFLPIVSISWLYVLEILLKFLD
jgi:hypothetical protein